MDNKETSKENPYVHVMIRNTQRNLYRLPTGHPEVDHVEIPPGKEARAEIHRDVMAKLKRLGFEVKEVAPADPDKAGLEGHGDYSEVNRNVMAGVQAGDKNTIDPVQRAAVAEASGDPRDLQGTAHADDPTVAQKKIQEEAGINSPGTNEDGGEDSIEKLLADVEQETLTFAQLRSRAKALLGNDFPSGYSPKKDEIVELLHNAQRKKARS